MLLPEITTFLVSQSTGATVPLVAGTNLEYGILPPDPDFMVAVLEYPGRPTEPDMGQAANRIVFPRIQVICRGVREDYITPRQVAQDIVGYMAKVGVAVLTLSGVRYLAINALSDPSKLRSDDNFRVEIVTNYEVYREATTS